MQLVKDRKALFGIIAAIVLGLLTVGFASMDIRFWPLMFIANLFSLRYSIKRHHQLNQDGV